MNFRHKYGIAFHYVSYVNQNEVVRNTFENGAWGEEERSGGVPFKKGQLFKVGILTFFYLRFLFKWTVTLERNLSKKKK